jgi:hypothetical protein
MVTEFTARQAGRRGRRRNFVGIRSEIFKLNTLCAYDLCGITSFFSLSFALFSFPSYSILFFHHQHRDVNEIGSFCANISSNYDLFAIYYSWREKNLI